ncbi:hypothetical protein NS359_08030 [Curtobacterium oceanosedimentum]|uniref:RanBP2-type domain-containing protein n=2 Tax=Curtobacterium oceanosedimentum TaxID=465820 RepID=A0A147DQZ1_9MICO|nr:hypothetical protein NS359_08030 [Curtobacterium oceanosedimentum]
MVVSLIASHVARHDAPPESAIDILPAVLAERAASRSTLHGAAAPQGGWNLNIADDMALDVLIAVAHRLSTSETVSYDQAVRDAVASLSAWELPKPVADVVAKQLLWFWDERAAVLQSDNGFIRARSRRWIDAADAIWVSRQDEETLRAWALERLQASGSLEAFPPALATDARVLQVIITVAADTTSIGASAVAVLAEWAAQGRIGSADAAAAFSALTTHARGVEPTPTNRPTPQTAETDRTRLRLVALSIPLPREERAARHAFLQDVAASETDVLVLEAIAATTDAVADQRFAVPPEVRKAFESIDLAEPKRDPMERDLRTGVYSLAARPRPRRPTGLIDFARHVINSEIEIKDEQAQWLFLAARTGSPDDWAQLTAALQSRGFESRTPFLDGSFLDGIVESLKPLTELRWYLEPLIKLPMKQVPPDWRLRDLSALLRAILAYEPSRITGQATSRLPMDLEDWLTTTARYYCLSIEQLVADANYALAMPLPALGRLALLLCESKEPLAGHPEALEDAWATVARLLSSESEWVSDTALEMLIAAKRRVPLPTEEEDSSGAIATHVAYNTALAYAWAAGDPFGAARDLLTRGRPAYRRAAAVVLRAVASDDASEAAVLALKSDRDWSVRVTAGANQVEAEGAAFWSCPDCDHENPGTDAISCEQCGLSGRPDAEHQPSSLAAAQGPGQSTTSRTRHGASSATSGTRVAG